MVAYRSKTTSVSQRAIDYNTHLAHYQVRLSRTHPDFAFDYSEVLDVDFSVRPVYEFVLPMDKTDPNANVIFEDVFHHEQFYIPINLMVLPLRKTVSKL